MKQRDHQTRWRWEKTTIQHCHLIKNFLFLMCTTLLLNFVKYFSKFMFKYQFVKMHDDWYILISQRFESNFLWGLINSFLSPPNTFDQLRTIAEIKNKIKVCSNTKSLFIFIYLLNSTAMGMMQYCRFLSRVQLDWIQFSSYTGCYNKNKSPSLITHNWRRIVGFILFPSIFVLHEMQTASSRIWT